MHKSQQHQTHRHTDAQVPSSSHPQTYTRTPQSHCIVPWRWKWTVTNPEITLHYPAPGCKEQDNPWRGLGGGGGGGAGRGGGNWEAARRGQISHCLVIFSGICCAMHGQKKHTQKTSWSQDELVLGHTGVIIRAPSEKLPGTLLGKCCCQACQRTIKPRCECLAELVSSLWSRGGWASAISPLTTSEAGN